MTMERKLFYISLRNNNSAENHLEPKHFMLDRVDLLINILCDQTAREDERHDAAMDLREFDDDRALNILLEVASNPTEENIILDACGESIAEIWVKRSYFDLNMYNKIEPIARRELYRYIKGHKPEWIKLYTL